MLRLGNPDPIYEIYLPLTYNDGSLIEEEKFSLTRNELVGRFGGLTNTPPGLPLQGWWHSPQGVVEDNIVIWRVVTPDDDDIFLREYQRTLEQRFIQDKVYIVKTQGEAL
ncbi:hypothetical protein ACFLUR_01900 [Chloroflexota bacterium]